MVFSPAKTSPALTHNPAPPKNTWKLITDINAYRIGNMTFIYEIRISPSLSAEQGKLDVRFSL